MRSTRVADDSEDFWRSLLPVPAVQQGVCRGCRDFSTDGADCPTCAYQGVPILPIALATPASVPVRYLLELVTGKDQTDVAHLFADLVNDFLFWHSGCLGGAFERVATVPSPAHEPDAIWQLATKLHGWDGRPNALELVTPKTIATASDLSGKRVLLLGATMSEELVRSARLLAHCRAEVQCIALVNVSDANPMMLARLESQLWDSSKCGICDGANCS